MSFRLVGTCLLIAGITATGCDSGPAAAEPIVGEIAIHGGDGQSAPAGGLLDDPLQVIVTNPTGEPIPAVRVIFRRSAGSQVQLSDTIATTGLDGIARVEVRLGPTVTAGPVEIAVAFIQGKPEDMERFRATATTPPTLTSITPSSGLQAGDTVTFTGTNFNQSPGGNNVYFGFAQGRVISATTTELRVVVPPCVPPGTVQAYAQIGSVRTANVAVTYAQTTPTLDLQPFEGITVSGTELGDCLRLAGDGRHYLIVPQFATAELPLQPVSYVLGSSGPVTMLSRATRRADDPLPVQFDNMLRRLGHEYFPAAQAYARERMPWKDLTPLADPALNSTQDFWVLNTLTPGAPNRFTRVTARLRYIGAHLYIYVDQTAPAPPNGFTDQQLRNLGDWFERDLYAIDVRTFGAETDIDRNGHVIVLLTPVVNRLTPKTDCGVVIGGFFFGWDFTSGANSNRAEIFYSLVPDPLGATGGCPRTVPSVLGLMPTAFIHEFQHMISYGQRAVVRRASDEATWLDEGLSHIAEEMGSRLYESRYPAPAGRRNPNDLVPDSSFNLIIGNLNNAYSYLRSPGDHSMTLFQATGTLEERGAAWLFLRWLGDQRDSTIYGRLVQSSRTSVENIEAVTGETFESLFADFSIALWADSIPNHPRLPPTSRFRFKSRNLRQLFSWLHREVDPNQYPLEFPLAPTTLVPSGSVSSSMVPGTMEFYIQPTPPGSTAYGLTFTGPGGTSFSEAHRAQVGILRLPFP